MRRFSIRLNRYLFVLNEQETWDVHDAATGEFVGVRVGRICEARKLFYERSDL